jgi:hypothetical protein
MRLVIMSLLTFFLTLTAAWAGPCGALAGRYRGIYDEAYRSEYSEVEIEERGGGLRVFYRQGEGFAGYEAVYVTDGESHPGDGKVSGREYRAACDADGLRVTALFAELKSPVGFDFKRTGDLLSITESLGEYRRETGRLRRVR